MALEGAGFVESREDLLSTDSQAALTPQLINAHTVSFDCCQHQKKELISPSQIWQWWLCPSRDSES